MEDQQLVHSFRDPEHEEVTRLKNNQYQDNTIDEDLLKLRPETKLKRIWIYSSARKVESPEPIVKGNDPSSAPVSALKDFGDWKSISRSALNGSPMSRKSQAKLDALLKDKIQPAKIAGTKRQNGDDLPTKTKRLKAQDSTSPERILSGPSTESAVEKTAKDHNVRKYLQEMSGEIIKYELRIASLHGRMKELSKENEKLRNYRSLCEKLTEHLVEEKRKNKYEDLSEGLRNKITKTSASAENSNDDDSDVDEGAEGGVIADSSDGPSLDDGKTAHKCLRRLESRILERLEEYRSLTKDSEKNLSATSQNRKDVQKESPFVSELKIKLIRIHQELSQVRSSMRTRLTNMKMMVHKERFLRQQMQQELVTSKAASDNWRDFAEKAGHYVKRYKNVVNSQQELIANYQNSQNAKGLSLKGEYNKLIAINKQLSQAADTRGKEIQTLIQRLNEEKHKNQFLECYVKQQRNQIMHVASVAGQATLPSITSFSAASRNDYAPHYQTLSFPTGEALARNANLEQNDRRLLPPISHGSNLTKKKTVSLIKNANSKIKQESPAPIFMSEQPNVSLESPERMPLGPNQETNQ